MENRNKAIGNKSGKVPGNKLNQKEIALGLSLKRMKLLIAALIVILTICIVLIIFFNVPEKQSIQTQSNSKRNDPALENAIKINPAHGEPGHRCDIPVGSPLDTPPTNAAEKVSNETFITPEETTSDLNPPHGEPGHRCEIPVGSPLDTQPDNSTAKTKNITSVPAVENTVKLNPPHGEPGHRCDVAVGSPLK